MNEWWGKLRADVSTVHCQVHNASEVVTEILAQVLPLDQKVVCCMQMGHVGDGRDLVMN